jgi:hypothetical protein
MNQGGRRSRAPTSCNDYCKIVMEQDFESKFYILQGHMIVSYVRLNNIFTILFNSNSNFQLPYLTIKGYEITTLGPEQ